MPLDDERRRQRGLRHLVLIAIVLLSGAVCRWRSADESPRDVEWEPFIRGVALWQTGDARLSYDVPPLSDAVVTAAIASRDDLPVVTDDEAWDGDRDVARLAYRQVRGRYAAGREALMDARRGATWWLLLGVVYVYAWVLRCFGWPAAVAAATLVGLNPLLLGHASYLGPDVAAAVTIVIALGELSRLCGDAPPRWVVWGTVPAALSAAMLTNHRGWLLLPVVAAVIVLRAWQRDPGPARRSALGRAVGYGLALAAILTLALNVGFAGRNSGLAVAELLQRPEPQSRISAEHEHELLETMTPLPDWPRSVPVPLPYTEVFGLGSAWTHALSGDPRAVYRGRRNKRGHWLFFPALLWTKTPLAVFALLVGGLAARLRRVGRNPAPRSVTTLVIASGALWLLLAMRWSPNVGVASVLHIEMLLCVLAGVTVGAAWGSDQRRWAGPLATIALASAAAAAIQAGPRPLAFSHALAPAATSISAVGEDEGQDRATLAAVMADVAPSQLWVHHASWAAVLEFKHLGLEHRPLRCRTQPPAGSWVAVQRRRTQTARARCFRWRDDLQPTFVIGRHIEVYWLPPDEPEPSDTQTDR